ncbi:hypothetical protein BH10ACT10_BH10ACT10_20830 [soil metagenome]
MGPGQVDGLTLDEAATLLGAQTPPTWSGRSRGSSASRRTATSWADGSTVRRALLLAGEPPATVAVSVVFHDQAHLHRHFTRLLGIGPGAYAASA